MVSNKEITTTLNDNSHLAAVRAIRYKSSRYNTLANPSLWAFLSYPWPMDCSIRLSHIVARFKPHQRQKKINSLIIRHFKYYYALYLLILLSACSTKNESKSHASSVKFDQYYLQGEQLYQTHCSNCHQKNGAGLGLLYPPLNKSDFIDNHKDDAICIIKFGKEGELVVNGKSFNKKMPGVASLTALEVSEIATYIFNAWTDKSDTLYSVKSVEQILSRCGNVE